MKEHPILFSAPMVRAILDGKKTQTRRIVKLTTRRHGCAPGMALLRHNKATPLRDGIGLLWTPHAGAVEEPMPRGIIRDYCPYGDRWLWVKETFCVAESPEGEKTYAYRADNWTECPSADGKWMPSIFCRRVASRIMLEIESVRVERLQAISESDAEAEGAHRKIWITSPFSAGAMNAKGERGTFRDGYKDLWEEINGPGSWAENPWVWVIEFRRIAP